MSTNSRFLLILSFLLVIGLSFLGMGLLQESDKVNLPAQQHSAKDSTSSANVAGFEGEQAKVIKVVDGDTIVVNINEGEFTVRFIGIDTPETVDPRRPVGCFGKEASNETKQLLNGKTVILQKDISDTDKYNRLLRYVYLPIEDGKYLFVNDYLVRKGFAKVYTYPPDIKFDEEFLEAEQEARRLTQGLWGSC